MNASQKVLLALVSETLFGHSEYLDTEPAIDWAVVRKEAKAQGVSQLALEGAVKRGLAIDEPVKAAWGKEAISTLITFRNYLTIQKQLIRDLDGFPMAIMKGMSVARYYPRPELRAIGDLDYLVEEARFPEAVETLTALGYDPEGGTNPFVFWKGKIEFEQHYTLHGLPETAVGKELDTYLRAGVLQAETAEIEGFQFPVLPVCQEGLVLLQHMIHHVQSSGLGLKQFYDWVLYVRKVAADKLPEELEQLLKNSGLYTFAQITTKLAKLYLGLPEQVARWADEADAEACEILLADIFDAGYMGFKKRSYYRGRQIIAERHDGQQSSAVWKALKNLQWIGLQNWTAVKKYPALKVIAWAYWPVQYTGKLLRGERKLSAIPSIVKGMNESRTLMGKLKLYQKK